MNYSRAAIAFFALAMLTGALAVLLSGDDLPDGVYLDGDVVEVHYPLVLSRSEPVEPQMRAQSIFSQPQMDYLIEQGLTRRLTSVDRDTLVCTDRRCAITFIYRYTRP